MLLPPECCICKELLKKDLCVEKLCGNVFHRDCFKTWLTVKDKCPLCQTRCNKTDVLDIHYELVKGNYLINEDNFLEKDKEELYAQLKKYEDDLQDTRIENQQKGSQIFTLENKNSILEETLKGMEVKKLKLKMELNSSKEANDEYIKENYILKSQIKEYEKELNKMKSVSSYLEQISKDESNNIYVTLGLNTLSEKEQITILFNYIKTMKELNKNYKLKIEELKKALGEKTEQLFQLKSENLQMNLRQASPDSEDEQKEKKNEKEKEKEKEHSDIKEMETNMEREQIKEDVNNLKIKTTSFRRIKRNKSFRPTVKVNNILSNHLKSDFSSNFSSNFSNSNLSLSVSEGTLSRSCTGNTFYNSHSPTIKLNNENKKLKSVDFMNFLDKKMNLYSPTKNNGDYTNTPTKKIRKSVEVNILRNKSVEGLFDDVIEGDGTVNQNIHSKCKSSNSSFLFSSFETTSNNNTPSPTHPNTEALFERVEGTTPLRVDYTTPKRFKKDDNSKNNDSSKNKDSAHKNKTSIRRNTTPSPSLRRSSSISSTGSNTGNETEGMLNGHSLKPYDSTRTTKKSNINRRKTYSFQSSKITDFFKKV